MWMTVQMKWCDFVCIIASAPLKIVAADVKKWVLCVFVCFSWSRSEALRVSAASLFSADLWRISRTALPAQSYSPKGAQVSWTLDGSEVTEGVQTSTESERDGRYSRSSVLSLSKARWEGAERFVCRVTHDGAAQETSFLKSSGCWCFSSEEQQDSQQSRDLQLNTQAVFQSAAIAVHSIKLLNALHLCSTASLISVSFLH